MSLYNALGTAGYQAATSNNTGGDNKVWGAVIAAGAQIVGGLINSRGARRANQMTRDSSRELAQADRESNRESLRTQMQMRQDDYAREIMRNRSAISPYAQMYSGPRFQGVDPNAPIYNPLQEEGSLYNQLSGPAQMPWSQPPRGG